MACNPDFSKGGCVPILNVEGSDCAGPVGGTKTAGAPVFVPVVNNPPSFIWTDEDLTVIQADEDGSPILFDNI